MLLSRLAQARLFLAAILIAPSAFADAATTPSTETIVLVRHGEKPGDGLGQLTCQGLNRALALPKVLQTLFGKPDFIFAPDPAHAKPDHIKSYDYVRPLATIEPTAVRFGLPVNTQIGWSDVKGIATALEQPAYRQTLVFVSWEHRKIVDVAQELMTDNGGSADQIPAWPDDDFDVIYVIRISRTSQGAHASFERKQEHLDGQSMKCPGEE